MKHSLVFFVAFAVLFTACSPKIVYVPGETRIEYRDTTIFHTDTVSIDVPVEVIKEVVPSMDTLFMETSVASAWAAVDTVTTTLKGELRNKPISLEKEIVYKERLVYRDSIVTKPYPVEVEKEVRYVPWIVKILAWFGGLSLVAVVLFILRKFGVLKI